MKTSTILANNVKSLLQVNNWTIARLAKECGLSVVYISGIKSDSANPTLEVLEKIANAFNVTPQDLINPKMRKRKAA